MHPDNAGESIPNTHSDPVSAIKTSEQQQGKRLPRLPYGVELLIGTGAVVGVLLRFLLTSLAHDHVSATFPIGTLLVNLLGCFVIGVTQTIFGQVAIVRREIQLFVTVGIIGGFTTFSAISVDSVRLLAAGLTTWLLGYQFATLAGGLAAVLLGTALTQAIHQYIARQRA